MGQDVNKPVEPAAVLSSSAVLQAKALQALRAREHELRAKGVTGLALFGSTARGDVSAASDVDLVLELDESAVLGLLDLVGLKEALAEELGRPVDIAFRSRLRPWFAARIAPDLVRVF
jgi:predicted nucleotidyltransferase